MYTATSFEQKTLRTYRNANWDTLDHLMEGVIILDFNWRYLYINSAAKLHSRLDGEFRGYTMMEKYPGIEATALFKTLNRCMQDRVQQRFETEFKFQTGQTGYFEISAQPVPEGVFILTADITERKITEQKLIKSKQRLKEAQAVAHMGSWEVDLETSENYWSDGVYEMFQLDRSVLPSTETFLSFIHPEDRAHAGSTIGDSFATLSNSSFEYRFIRGDKAVRYGYAECVFEFDSTGKPIRLYGIVMDITGRRKAEIELEKTLQEMEMRIQQRTRELEDKNSNIMDSIAYAKHIQSGLLCRPDRVSEIFPKSFIFSQPCDIVSGDFFWCHQRRHKKFIAVADCTGHGVPAALMSIMGNNLLNQIIVNENIDNPSEILELLDERIAAALQGDSALQQMKDGMDIALCVIDTYFNEIYYAGAYRPLFISNENGTVAELQPSPYAIGGAKTSKRFETQRFSIAPGQRIYLTSDGYYCQFGGPKGKKFMKSNFIKKLESIQSFSMEQQSVLLQDTLESWTNGNTLIDDVMVLGVEL